MTPIDLPDKAQTYLRTLCTDLATRRVGSEDNRAATTFFAETIARFGFEVETPEFTCIDWLQEGVELTADGQVFAVQAGPYSLGCQARAPLTVISTVAELEAANLTGQVVLLHGEIAAEQLMPKNFPFYNPDTHQHIIRLLEHKQPVAILSATTRNPEVAGAVYPFPLIEDGDFDIPSAYMTAEEGVRLAAWADQEVHLTIRAQRIPTRGCNVVARKGQNARRRVVLFAHIDAKEGTPGALDNAAGITTLLLLAELLADYSSELAIEIVALNGEDYYAASGEILWVEQNAARFGEIVLGINLDGLGYREGKTAYSLYDCPSEMAVLIRTACAEYDDLAEGDAWYQSDHSLFIQHGRPALALTSDAFTALWMEIAHTAHDVPELVDPVRLVHAASALQAILVRLTALRP